MTWTNHYSTSGWQKVFTNNPEDYKARYQEIKRLLGSAWYVPNFPSEVTQMVGLASGIGLALGLRRVISVNN